MPEWKPATPPLYELRGSEIQGMGAFATRRIRKGTRILEYIGEKITPEEADRRYDDDAMDRHHTFLFIVDDDVVLDAANEGNEARYINHSCEPNCEAIIEDGRVFVEALRTIQGGEELLYDYQYEREGAGKEAEALYPCFCGAPTCRGSILVVKEQKKKKRAGAAKKKRKRGDERSRGGTKRVVGKSRRGAAGKKGGAAKRGAAKRGAAKRGAAKRGAAKRGAAKRGATKRGAAKRGATRRGAAKRGAAKRGTSRR